MSYGAAPTGTAADSDWSWTGGKGAIALDLVLVRDTPVEHVIGAFALESAAEFIPHPQDGKPFEYAVHDERLGAVSVAWIRAGRAGDWVFAVSPSLTEILGAASLAPVIDAVRELSRGAASILNTWTPTIDAFRYFEDGVPVTCFEPLRSYDRRGSDPDRFAAAMRQAGLAVDPGETCARDRDPGRDVRIRALEMLTLALGIRVPAELACGPLPTIQHRGPVARTAPSADRPPPV